MASHEKELTGPDLTAGISADQLSEGEKLLGHAGGEPVLLVRLPDGFFAIGATCTHYSGPLAEGLLVDDTVRCPWHHACFSLRSGEALRAPALNPVASWKVEVRSDKVFVTEKVEKLAAKDRAGAVSTQGEQPSDIVIVGAGAAGDAAAEMLRRQGFGGRVVLIGEDAVPPYDRPNLSKDYLAGTAPEEWLPLRGPDFYADKDIELVLNARVTSVDADEGRVALSNGEAFRFDRLLLATGSSPVHLPVPGADLPHVHYLRTLADCRSIIEHVDGKSAVLIGAGFIGMEVAASLRAREMDVVVVAPESQPLERVLGTELGAMVRALHEENGVRFRLGRTAGGIGESHVTLSDGETLAADLVIVGIGVRPETALAEKAGLEVDNGVIVDEFLETSRSGIFAAGDIARWPDHRSGRRIRVEHWVVAQRQGQVAARNMLGGREPFAMAPFFWSQHYDYPIAYVGHAEGWDDIEILGSVEDRDFVAAFKSEGKTLAVASVFRDEESLMAEAAMERDDENVLNELTKP
jgi:NADPH-dependent 2,4-dienoyl-CoA reductase/sulfur reductase-like enzyme/nitrite reductase/ring-hydroxylating ferredoxin subunit